MQKVIERILNLLAFLLTAERPVTADEIRHTVAGYDRDNDVAFHRTFERDKAILRRLGIPIEREATDVFEVEFGYVVDHAAYGLDDPGLSDDERVALSLAVQAVGFGGRPAGYEGLMKLGGAVGSLAGTQLGADIGSHGDSLDTAFAAISERRLLSFTYHGKARRIEPYGLVHRRGRWYLIGREKAADLTKVYRLDRAGALTAGDQPSAFLRPQGFNASEAVLDRPWETGEDDIVAHVAFDGDVAWIAQRELGPSVELVESSDGSLEAHIVVSSPDAFIAWIVGFEDKAEILAPGDLRDRFLDHIGGSL